MQELLTQFGIDWKLLIAQVVNFFILLTILRVFAYKPILKMLGDRRTKIEEGLQASEESKKRLSETKIHEQAILLKAEQNALGIVSEAEKEAKEEESRILQGAHKKQEAILASSQKKLEQDALKLEEEVQKNARELVQKGLAKIAPQASIDARLIDEALRELKTVTRS